jgi:hypothetical protein
MSSNNGLVGNLCIRKMKSFFYYGNKNHYYNEFFGVGKYVSSIEKYHISGFNYCYYYYYEIWLNTTIRIIKYSLFFNRPNHIMISD